MTESNTSRSYIYQSGFGGVQASDIVLQHDAVVNAVASAITKPIYDTGIDQTVLALSDEDRKALVMDLGRFLLAKAHHTGKARIVEEFIGNTTTIATKRGGAPNQWSIFQTLWCDVQAHGDHLEQVHVEAHGPRYV